MATPVRIYKVVSLTAQHLVQASSQSQALRHIAGKEYQVEIAKSVDVAKLMSKGAKVEIAANTEEQADLALDQGADNE